MVSHCMQIIYHGMLQILLHYMRDKSVTMASTYIELQVTTKSIEVIEFNVLGTDILANGTSDYYGVIDVFVK